MAQHLTSGGIRLDSAIGRPSTDGETLTQVFVDPPAEGWNSGSAESLEPLARKFDVAKRDARNRELGRAGEEFVVAVERDRLTKLGLINEASKVTWVSRDQGDGLGYDVLSFAEDSTQLFIEVKTTHADIDAPFYITERERAVSARKGASYRLYRVFRFSRKPQIYVLRGPLEDTLRLKPAAYRATVRTPEG
ncbi:DUF3883 domain-containing protein [Sinorhizobium fredii]|uniref:DUF3883 domain-containing protein n=1 Tax=Rhizobium fredii TaxID=380 RepID=UPI003B9828CF